MVVQYALPEQWVRYDLTAIVNELTSAKAAVMSLTAIPFQRSWAEKLQQMELKREVAGTSRIEGADFTEKELDEALSSETPENQLTRSQRQARAAVNTYKWIEGLPIDRPIDEGLIKEIHRRIVTGCDDDHCPPGELRGNGNNVVFGRPRHRGVEGGIECLKALKMLTEAVSGEFRRHDPLIQALALHFHLGALHPFHDGNGRTARALEALMLQRAQLKDTLSIAMSNYYYDEKNTYLAVLSEVRVRNYDLTPFLKFGLTGIAHQCQRLLREIRAQVQKSLCRDVMGKMYGRLRSKRKRALADRQVAILNKLLDLDNPIDHLDLYEALTPRYARLDQSQRAFIRDLNGLTRLGATSVTKDGDKFMVKARLEWPTEITETEFFKQINELPEAKTKLLVSG